MTTATSFTAESAALPTTRQDDLSDAYMDGGPAPLWPLFQGLGNAKAAHDAALINAISWSGDVSIAPGQVLNNFTITVGAINAVMLYNGTIYKVFSSSGASVTQAKVEGGGGTLGASAQWWYLYAYNNGGTLDYEVSTTPPNANRIAKNGDATRRYLGCFRTLSTGAPIPFRATRGRYLYRASGSAIADTRALDAGSATSNTAVSLTSFIPPHARLATIRAQLTNTAAAFNYAYLRTDGDSGADELMIPLPNIDTADATAMFDIETDADREIAYRVTAVSSAPDLTLWVAGFYE